MLDKDVALQDGFGIAQFMAQGAGELFSTGTLFRTTHVERFTMLHLENIQF
jgi:hypothetical protein